MIVGVLEIPDKGQETRDMLDSYMLWLKEECYAWGKDI
jgi:hypothetical protein